MATSIRMGTFGIRNDKDRGIIIESVKTKESNVFFFKYADQPIDRHCQQIQQLVRSAKVKRAKKVTVDMTAFLHEYYLVGTDTVVSKWTQLNSNVQQEIRSIKRENTMAKESLCVIEGDEALVKGSEDNRSKSTGDLKFDAGETNPLLFLTEFEKRHDLKNDEDKVFKLRQFVNEEQVDEFNQVCYRENWLTVKTAFIKTFSMRFIQNKKRDLNIDFKKEPSLRSFVDRKLSGLEKYTTLSFANQMEMVLNDLPNHIANLFMVNEKLECSKTDILHFCDSIQVHVSRDEQNVEENVEDIRETTIFNYDPDDVLDSASQTMLRDQSHKPDLAGPSNAGLQRQNSLTSDVEEPMEYEVFAERKENTTKSSRSGRGSRTSRVVKGKVVKPGRSNTKK